MYGILTESINGLFEIIRPLKQLDPDGNTLSGIHYANQHQESETTNKCSWEGQISFKDIKYLLN